MPTVDINLWAVLVAALANMVLGFYWYSPAGFGKAWMKESGMTEAKINASKKKGMNASYFLALVSAFVMAYVLAHIIDFAQATTLVEGLQAGFWCWLGFVATVGTGMVLWDGKSWKLYGIIMGYYLVALLVMGAILATWM